MTKLVLPKAPLLKSRVCSSVRHFKSSAGFTLIEILIVLGILAAVMAFGLSRIQQKENNIKSVARNFLVLSKEIRNHARLTGSTLRLVIQLDPEKPKYWVEKSSGTEIRAADEEDKKLDDDEKPKTSFQIFKTLNKKEKELPSGLFFSSLEITNQDPITQGTGFIYYSPEGFIDASALQITNKKITWTLIFNPLTGQADLLPEAKSLKDINR